MFGSGFDKLTLEQRVGSMNGINPILETERDDDQSPNIFNVKGQRQNYQPQR